MVSIFLAVCGYGCSHSASAAPVQGQWRGPSWKTVTHYSYFIGLWLVGSWLGPATPEALLVSPSPPSASSMLGRSPTWKQNVEHRGRMQWVSSENSALPTNTGFMSVVLELTVKKWMWPPLLSPRTSLGIHVLFGGEAESRTERLLYLKKRRRK